MMVIYHDICLVLFLEISVVVAFELYYNNIAQKVGDDFCAVIIYRRLDNL